MKKFFNILLFLSCVLFFVACEQESMNDQIDTEANTSVILTKKQSKALLANGISPITEDLETITLEVFGKTMSGVKIGDYFQTNDQINSMAEADHSSVESRLFASTNRISLPQFGKRTLRVAGVGTGIDRLPNKSLSALFQAVSRYNQLGMAKLDMSFTVVTEAEANNGADFFGPLDIVVFVNSNRTILSGGNTGIATFPNAGNPGPFVALSADLNDAALNNITSLIQHELGHTIGMVHADFLTRRTCGNQTPLDPVLGDLVGVPNVTEVCNIVGTDNSGDFDNSIMRACGIFAIPNFTNEDVDAFRKLYSDIEIPCAGNDNNDNNNNNCTPQSEVSYLPQYFIQILISIGLVCP